MVGRDSAGNIGVYTIYQNADKIFNLKKESPIGAITWGSGGIGTASISTIVKDFRKMTENPEGEWFINPNDYSLQDVARNFRRFVFDEKYQEAFGDWEEDQRPAIGFIIAGYSSNEDMAEEWRIAINHGNCPDPEEVRDRNDSGIIWNGEPEAITRLYYGFSSGLSTLLQESGFIDPANIDQLMAMLSQRLAVPLITPPMPIQDAIDLSKFLVDMTIKYKRFCPGAPTVGGPIDVAAITKHEHFKWIQRKHYYDQVLNPP
jgi:hypothetical protein